MAKINSTTLVAVGLFAVAAFLGITLNAHALSTYVTAQGGTGTSSPSGILYGDAGATNHLNTVKIGSGITFSGGTITATGGSATPGGASSTVQYNANGALAGITNLTTDGTNPIFYGVTPTGVIGTGNMVLSVSPTFTGTPVTAALRGGTAVSSAINIYGTSAAAPTTATLTLATALSTTLGISKLTFSNSGLSLGTTTGIGMGTFDIATSSANTTFKPQFVLTDTSGAVDTKHFGFSYANGTFNAGSMTDAFATTSALSITSTGNVGIGTTSPMSRLSVVGDENHWGNYVHFGSSAPSSNCKTVLGAESCVELIGNDNTIGGVLMNVQNINSGASAYGGYLLTNSLGNTAVTNYSGTFLNGPNYSDVSYGTLNNVPNLLQLANSMGGVSIQSFAPTQAASFINFFAGSTTPGAGPSASGEVARITSTGLGVGTTTPQRKLHVADAGNVRSQVAIEDTTATPDNHLYGLQTVNGTFNLNKTNDAWATTTVASFNTTTCGGTMACALVGTTTQMTGNTAATFTTGTSATTTVNVGNIGDSTAKACLNLQSASGAAVAAYIVGTSWVIELGTCK